VSPLRPSRLMVHDRARRELISRPIALPLGKTTPGPGIKPAPAPEATPAATDANPIAAPKRGRATRVVLLAMIGMNFGAVLGLVGWPVLQAFKIVNAPVIEVVQREQAEMITQLDATVHALNAAVADLSTRAASAAEREAATNLHLAEIDAALGAARTSLDEMRAAQSAAKESWREPVAELTAATTKARGDIVRLRALLEELRRSHPSETVALTARLDRIEQAMVQHELLSAIRGSIPAPMPAQGERQGERSRSLAAQERSSAADGHIINLTPAP
jgi:hypothetical protein